MKRLVSQFHALDLIELAVCHGLKTKARLLLGTEPLLHIVAEAVTPSRGLKYLHFTTPQDQCL